MADSPLPIKRYRHFWPKLFYKKTRRRRLVRAGFVVLNVLLFGVVLFVVRGPHGTKQLTPAIATSSNVTPATVNPLDEVSSANIAVTAARLASMPETTAVVNQADSQTAELAVVSASDSVAAKPQVVTNAPKTKADIQTYTTQAGDTLSSLAAKFGVTSDSIRWSNNLTGSTVAAGTKLVIPPITGIVYTVQAGDTADSLARKFNVTSERITAYNDAEITGLKPGERIVIPDGSKISPVSSFALASASASYGWGGGSANYGYNGYDYGYCTWWVAKMRAAAGNPVPANLGNAATWAIRAAQFGIPTGTTPKVGAAVVLSTSGAGHVGYVTAVNGDGTITISEMNHVGWNRTDTRTLSGAGFKYVY